MDMTTLNELKLPNNKRNLLLHSCCAPCSGSVIEMLIESEIKFSIYFYNPNIHPEKEYLLRKQENIDFANKHNIPFIDADYDTQNWFDKAKGMEDEPERGSRCSMCFTMRFERTAKYALENGFDIISSCLGISRWKDMNQINNCGEDVAGRYGIDYWTFNWRKNGGSARMYEIAKSENMYKQEYCGCVYSLRDTNKWRKKNNRTLINFGNEHYS